MTSGEYSEARERQATRRPRYPTLDQTHPDVEVVTEAISGDEFERWYRARDHIENIRQGRPYLNTPSPPSNPEQHSASQLLNCHRKTYYAHHNAPEETEDPDGVFWFGTHFETDIIVPFLQTLTCGTDRFVRNSMWVEFETDSPAGELQFRGETDPVIVDHDSTPQLLTEVKTTSSIDAIDEPKTTHKAQAHVYMKGLSQEYETDVCDTVLIYGDRDDLEVRTFHVVFDPDFWEDRVLEWAATNSSFLAGDALPPADPERSWECEYCAFRHRCGQADDEYGPTGVEGFLPGFDYPKSNVLEYLRAVQETNDRVALPPTIATQHPEVADQYPVGSWECPVCHRRFDWNEVRDTSQPDLRDSTRCSSSRAPGVPQQRNTPLCSHCSEEKGIPVTLVDSSDLLLADTIEGGSR